MAKFLTNLTGMPYGDPNMTQWYTLYKEALQKIDTSLFSHRENKDLISIGGGNIAYDNVAFELTWDSVIQILHPISSKKNDIPATTLSNVPFGSYVYVNIKRNIKNNGGIISIDKIKISSSLPNNDFNYVLFYITDAGELVTNINTTITSTPVDNPIVVEIDEVASADFPNNPIASLTGIHSLFISDVVSKNDKTVRFQLRYPDNYDDRTFSTNFIVSSPFNTEDLFYSIKIDKQVVGGSSITTVPVLDINNNKTLTAVDNIVSVNDENTFDMISGEFYTFEITFLNNLVTHLGFNGNVELYTIFFLSQ